jgi:RHS repeat-associated protein
VRIFTSRLILALLAALIIPAGAGSAVVLYKDDFQSYGTQKNPPGWVDNAIGKPAPAADGLYKTWPDPAEGSKGTNVVFGTKQSSGRPKETNPRIGKAGDAVKVDAPGFEPASATFDSRGLLLEETRPDTSTIARNYDALGNLTEYRDESGRVTSYTYDGLGRLTRTNYPDRTSEEIAYATPTGAVRATRDRAGVWVVNDYDVHGRVAALRHGGSEATPAEGGPELVRYTYDEGSRIKRIANRDSAIEFEDFDFAGRARLTRLIRYADHGGLSASPTVRDLHAMEHRYDVFGQVTEFRMPAAGVTAMSVPPSGGVLDGWLGWIEQEWDGGGNLVAQRSMEPDGTLLSTSEARGVGRLTKRTTNVVDGVPLSEFFSYADGPSSGGISDETGTAPPPYDGTLAGITVFANGIPIAGSEVGRDAARRITRSDSYGLADRSALFAYDGAGRLVGDAAVSTDDLESPGLFHENSYTPAESRLSRATRSGITDAQLAKLEEMGEGDVVPRGWSAAENEAHAIDLRTIGATQLDYHNQGGRRTSDGVWTSEYDEFGRLVARTRSDGEARRIEYLYDPNDRIIARIAKQPAGANAWEPETRTDILARDGLPADTTWIWDGPTDRLVAIYEAGKSVGATDSNAGLLRQYLHGDQGYDDPTHVLVRDPAASPGEIGVLHYRTIVDPLAGGSVTTVVDSAGHLVERILYADAYGDAPRYLHGAVVDKISIHAENDGSGAIAKVVFRARLSERIDPASLQAGARLEAMRGDGSTTPAPAAVTPELFEETTVQWTLTASDWRALTADATSIRIAITSSLRTPAWGDRPPMPAPSWAQTLFGVDATATNPVMWTESLANVEMFFTSITGSATREKAIYAIPDLYLAASDASNAQLFIGFKAAPFVEADDRSVYVRARWYDPETGTWLTPDSESYLDSSGAYVFCAADPLNCSDPTGRWAWWDENIDSLDEDGRREFRGLASASVGTTPFFGEISDALQFVTGFDVIAGEKLEAWEQVLAGASFLVPFAGASTVRKGVNAGVDAVRDSEALSGGVKQYLVSQRRVARYEAKLKQLQASGKRGEKLAELSGRIEMMREGFLRAGHGIYQEQTRVITTASGKQIRRRVGGKGIDSIYSDQAQFVGSGYSSRLDYHAALARGDAGGNLAILESKWRSRFSIAGMAESLLGRGILDPGAVGRLYFRQMSPNWVAEVTLRLRGSTVPGANQMGGLLRRHGRSANRYVNVLNHRGESVLHRMR